MFLRLERLIPDNRLFPKYLRNLSSWFWGMGYFDGNVDNNCKVPSGKIEKSFEYEKKKEKKNLIFLFYRSPPTC